mmetsp:Transcript_22688/g.32420  ORF Transcript_22688/g.32420 Transcript_22688/m.32420 type:complete len:142 (+) Transcript_22688:761-1186(+)
MVDGEDPNQTTESNCDSNTESESVSAVRPSLGIDVLTILDPEKRAMATRLMQIDATPECNLSYNGSNNIQHESLKRLCPGRWLDDGIINGFNKHILRPKLGTVSHFLFSFHESASRHRSEWNGAPELHIRKCSDMVEQNRR